MHQFIAEPLDFIMLGGVLVLSILIDFTGHSKGVEMVFKTACAWFLFWVAVAVAFGGYLYLDHGSEAAGLYFSGYLLEKTLSVDNLMVMMAIFSSFGIACAETKHKILLWGIAGAIIFRAIFVLAGTALFNLHWAVQCLFGAIVMWSAMAILKGGDDDEDVDYTKHWAVKPLSKILPISYSLDGAKFLTKMGSVTMATPALVCMVVIELSDVMFSFDSVPAVIGITKEPLLVYAAMIMAILGLRSLFFVLQSLMKYLTRLDLAVAAILVFVGAKLIVGGFGYHVDAMSSLSIIGILLVLGIAGSLVFPEKE